MTISQRIFQILKENHLTQKEFAENSGISESTISDWKKKGTNPAADKLSVIADSIGVSLDYLITGKEKSSPTDLTDDEQEIIDIYRGLNEINKARFAERGLSLIEQQKPIVKKAFIVARSTNNAPPRIVEGDFSDVLNAPDATDEY